ncbi:hypothetical protein [Mycolicibacterium sp. A43C]
MRDSFTVEVDNGAAAEGPGLFGALARFVHDWALHIGMADAGTAETKVDVNVTGDGQFGDAEYNKRFWVKQSFYNCQLIATAMAIGQATNSTSPTEQQMSGLAATSDSVFIPGQKMYLGDYSEDGVYLVDAIALANNNFNVTATLTTYGGGNTQTGAAKTATQADGQQALADLQAALARGEAAMVSYPVSVVWSTFGFVPGPTDSYTQTDHAAVVTQVDLANGRIYVNDSSATDPNTDKPVGQGLAVPIGAFLNGWQAANYALVTFAAK